jgi:hypothetical protein
VRVLDLFCGLGGWSKPFRDRGHEVVGVDLNPDFSPTICADVMDLNPQDLGEFDLILASPPCEAFSVASIGHHWGGGRKAYKPITDHARASVELVRQTIRLICGTEHRWFVIENPRGVLRKLGWLDDFERITVTFCAYGDTRMKPTDLWGGFPDSWHPRPMCKNGRSCHEAAPRGSKTGTQGLATAAERAVIPEALALSICIACENAEHGREVIASPLSALTTQPAREGPRGPIATGPSRTGRILASGGRP